jgi:hypothetical protein
MENMSWLEMILLFAPILGVWLALLVAGLVDLVPRQHTRGPKWIWFCVVILFSIIGPVAYFLFGREEA